jgi:hypothetical protein
MEKIMYRRTAQIRLAAANNYNLDNVLVIIPATAVFAVSRGQAGPTITWDAQAETLNAIDFHFHWIQDLLESGLRFSALTLSNIRMCNGVWENPVVIDLHTNATPSAIIDMLNLMVTPVRLIWAAKEGDAVQILPTKPTGNPALNLKVTELEGLGVRTLTSLNNNSIEYVGQLVTKTESEMLRIPNFGRVSLNQVKEALQRLGLKLDMEGGDWSPPQTP